MLLLPAKINHGKASKNSGDVIGIDDQATNMGTTTKSLLSKRVIVKLTPSLSLCQGYSVDFYNRFYSLLK